MGQPSDHRMNGAWSNVDRLINALRRRPGITEISLGNVFSPGDFFNLSEYRQAGSGSPMTWTHRIAEVIRTAVAQGRVRAVPTSHSDYMAYYATDQS